MKPLRKTCILVLGMHRSGTSALTQAVSIAGATLPATPMLGKADNKAGHWESQKLVDLHEVWLRKMGSHWDDFRALDMQTLSAARRTAFFTDLKTTLEAEYGEAETIVVKDPRLCRFSKFYTECLQELGYDVKVISIIRNPLEVVESLKKRDGFSDVKGLLLWLRHVLDAEYDTQSLPRSFLFHDDFMKFPPQTFKSALEILPWQTSQCWADIEAKINQVIQPDLRHHERTIYDLQNNATMQGWALDVFDILRHAQTQQILPPNLRERLNVIYAAMNESALLFHQMQSSIEGLEDERADLSSKLSRSDENVSSLISTVTQRDADITTLQQVVSKRDVDIGVLQQAISKKDTDIGILQETVLKKDTDISSLQEAVTHKEAEIISQNKEIDSLTSEVRKSYAIITHRDGDIETLTASLKKEAELNAFHREQFLAVINSTSWRIMRGPRWIIRQVKAFPRRVYNTVSGRVFYNRLRRWTVKHDLATNRSAIQKARQELAKERSTTLGADWHKAMVGVIDQSVDMPAVTMSIVTYNSEKWLPAFLKSVEGLDYPLKKLTLHFVDHGSQDGTTSVLQNYIKKQSHRFRAVKLSERPNLGYGLGNDYAMRESEDPFVLVTNVDTELYPDSLKCAVMTAVHDDLETACWEFRQAPHEHPKYYDPVSLLTNWCAHACVLMRRDHYLKVGGYEPRIFMYGEDVELSYRFRAHGFKLRYVPKAVLTHYVDLEDTTVRPHQLSGSISANILLRYRYGTWKDILAGEVAFRGLRLKETDETRRKAFESAAQDIRKNRWYYFKKKRVGARAHFPFQGFDYDIARPGAAVAHQPYPKDQDKLPVISVITRTHGPSQQHLDNAIASVLNQTYAHIEHVIVEDRTEDAENRVTELSALYPERLRYMRSTKEAGRSACGNYGARRAKGRYLCWLDNDDMLFADHIELLVRGLEQDRRAVCSYALAWDTRSTVENGTHTEVSFDLPDVHNQPYDPARLEHENFIPIQAIIFRKSLFKKYGGFNTEFDALEDWNLWVRYAQAGPFVFTPKVTSVYRTPDNEVERQKRHLILHAAYETVVSTNAKEIAAIRENG